MSTATGSKAEVAAANYLANKGFKIVDQNWRTRQCEIDIVAERKQVMHFVEVKYRHTAGQGHGLDYITPQKLKQMRFAANIWVADHKWQSDYCLSAVEVSADFKVTEFIETIV